MNKSISILFLTILCISSCNKFDAGKINNANIPLSVFIIGNWKSELQYATDIYGDYQLEYQVEFLNKSKLTFCNRNPRESFCDSFTYKLVNGNTYKVENERAKDGRWEISRAGDNLLICIWSDNNCVEFKRQ